VEKDMSIVIKTEPADGNILKSHVEGDVTIYTVAELKDQMVEDLHDYAGIEINLEKVAKIDTSGYQLMLMLKKEALKLKKDFRISSASEDVKRIYKLYHQEI